MTLMAPTNRDRRAAKQRRRDVRRGREPADAVAGVGTRTVGRGLPPETLRGVLRSTAADLARGDDTALTELRHLLAEHLARRRNEILAACDDVLADVHGPAAPDGPVPEQGRGVPGPAGVPAGLASRLGGPGAVSRWADEDGVGTEEAAVATVRALASTH